VAESYTSHFNQLKCVSCFELGKRCSNYLDIYRAVHSKLGTKI